MWAVGTSVSTAYYFNQHRETMTELRRTQDVLQEARSNLTGIEADYVELREQVVVVDVIVDFGNDTVVSEESVVVWSDEATALTATFTAFDIDYTVFDFGILVESIEGVRNDQETGQFWLYSVNRDGQEISPEVGAGQFDVQNGDVIRWTYTQT